MSSAVAELDGYLQQMLALKPPGVSGSKISSITSLCTANVQVCLSKEILFPYSQTDISARAQGDRQIVQGTGICMIALDMANPCIFRRSLPPQARPRTPGFWLLHKCHHLSGQLFSVCWRGLSECLAHPSLCHFSLVFISSL